jgi:CheY-like chemotaxis protein
MNDLGARYDLWLVGPGLIHCHVAKQWGAALVRARECTFALAISDLRMPGMTGLEFLTTLRQGQPDCGRIMLGITDVRWGSDGSFALKDLGEVEL